MVVVRVRGDWLADVLARLHDHSAKQINESPAMELVPSAPAGPSCLIRLVQPNDRTISAPV
jgi:hypothetical protein